MTNTTHTRCMDCFCNYPKIEIVICVVCNHPYCLTCSTMMYNELPDGSLQPTHQYLCQRCAERIAD